MRVLGVVLLATIAAWWVIALVAVAVGAHGRGRVDGVSFGALAGSGGVDGDRLRDGVFRQKSR